MEAVFNISLPTSWEELSDKQLLMVYDLFSRDLSSAEVKTLCLMKWNNLRVIASLPDKRFLVKKKVSVKPDEQSKAGFISAMTRKLRLKAKGEPEVALTSRQIQQATSVLDFLDAFAPVPVRISHIGRHKAIAVGERHTGTRRNFPRMALVRHRQVVLSSRLQEQKEVWRILVLVYLS